MLFDHRTYIAREGWLPVAVAVSCGVAVYLGSGLPAALPVFVITFLLMMLFRDPVRSVPSAPLGVVSPVDGRVIAVRTLNDDRYLDRELIAITIRMQMTGVYTTRSPIEGKIINLWIPGQRIIKEHNNGGAPALSSDRFAMWVQTDEHDDVLFAVKARKTGLAAYFFTEAGQRVGQGQRCGYFVMGKEAEVYVPANSRIEVKTGDRVRSGSDIIATLIHK